MSFTKKFNVDIMAFYYNMAFYCQMMYFYSTLIWSEMLDFSLLRVCLLGMESILPLSPLPIHAKSSLLCKALPSSYLNVLKNFTCQGTGHWAVVNEIITCYRIVLLLPHENEAEPRESWPASAKSEFMTPKQCLSAGFQMQPGGTNWQD